MTVSPVVEVTAVATAAVVTTWLVTYLLHSTLLFMGVAGLVRWTPLAAANRVTLWRLTLLLPFVSATIHTVAWVSVPLQHQDPFLVFPAPLIDWRVGMVVLMSCLVLVMHVAVRWALDRRRLGRAFGPRVLADAWLRDEVLTLARKCDAVTPRVTTSARTDVPAALGRREICLPASALARWSAEERRAIIAHELAHLEHGDTRVFPWCVTAAWLVPVQPLNWLSLRRIRHAAEQAADDRAVEVTGNAEALATALISLLDHQHQLTPTRGTAATGSPIVTRVARLLDHRAVQARWVGRIRAAIAGALLVVLMITGPGLVLSPRDVVNQLPWLTPGPGTPHERLVEFRQTSRAWRTTLRETFR